MYNNNNKINVGIEYYKLICYIYQRFSEGKSLYIYIYISRLYILKYIQDYLYYINTCRNI